MCHETSSSGHSLPTSLLFVFIVTQEFIVVHSTRLFSLKNVFRTRPFFLLEVSSADWWGLRGGLLSGRLKIEIEISLSSVSSLPRSPPAFCFLNLLGCQTEREVMREVQVRLDLTTLWWFLSRWLSR